MRPFTTVWALSLAGLLGGCFEANIDGKFQPNGSVRLAVEIGISAQLLAMSQGKDGGDPFGSCGNLQRMDQPPKGVKLLEATRGVKGDKIICRIVGEIEDPIAAAQEATKREAKPNDPLVLDRFKLTRLGDNGYRLESLIEANPKIAEAKPAKPDSGADAMGKALATTMMANHFITFSISGERIENSTGEMSADGKTTTWRLPVILFVSPVAGFRREIKADVIFRESWWDRMKRFVGVN